MKRWTLIGGIFTFLALITSLLSISLPAGATAAGAMSQIRLGGELYDNWYASEGEQPPSGNMPIWDRQSTNTRSGAYTWRCVSCHGWDYQGKDGAYRAGTNFTGFPGIFQASQESPQTILDQLTGKQDPQHDFSGLIDENGLNALVAFITNGLVDDNPFIDSLSLEVIGGDALRGKQLYEGLCGNCHGPDGMRIQFQFSELDANLGTLAILDPWRFLHKTRYGTPGTAMGKAVGVEQQWSQQQSLDVLAYAQGLPSGLTLTTPAAGEIIGEGDPSLSPQSPAQDWLTGLLEVFARLNPGLGVAILAGAALIGILMLLISLLRGKRK